MKKLLAAVTVLAVSTAQADTIYVDDNGLAYSASIGPISIPVGATGVAGGSTVGDDDSTFIGMNLFNDAASTADVVTIAIDGSTNDAFPILWDSAGHGFDPPGATSVISGVDTQLLTIDFLDAPDGFNPGETFTLQGMDPDGDPGPTGVLTIEMVGVRVTFLFEDGSSWVGEFVDDPAPGAGLVLV